ncbi:MAG: class I SAM-dependent methyltransferase [Proteobacteria bacterium]|nr:class I SAM-dependent methyltransferase [Pseudomonadota bacterium]
MSRLIPTVRRYLEASHARHLPFTSRRGRLLDVGCGSGDFVQFASHLGWSAEGIDNDPAAVASAQAAGRNVLHGTVNSLPLRPASYDHITLGQVIEHVHDPVSLLQRCFDLLVPGGRLWLETPNLQSTGHDVFGPSWRGLEPPRHLVLFDRQSLSAALLRAGFSSVDYRPHPGVPAFMWLKSRVIADASGGPPPTGANRLMTSMAGALVAEAWSTRRPKKSEFLTCLAFRPDDAK